MWFLVMERAQLISQLLRDSSQIWTGRQIAPVRAKRTGYELLDRLLPGHGWPLNALIEILPVVEGMGELQLLLPVLKRLTSEARDIILIRPPHVPYPPALERAGLPLNRLIWIDATSDSDARWAAEQTLREGIAGAVLLWSDCAKDMSLRRLQLAAREGEGLAFLYRSPNTIVSTSPASVRLKLHPAAAGMKIEILKAQGGRTEAVTLPLGEAA
jgi:cell division inhibitor SulA